MKNTMFLLCCLLGLYSCANDKMEHSTKSTLNETASPVHLVFEETEDLELKESDSNPIGRKDLAASTLQNRQLIKTADYRMQVAQVNTSTANIQRLAQELGGLISNMNLTSTAHQVQNNLTILVPNQNFEMLLSNLSEEAVFINQKQIKTIDVTEEFVDITARLKTKKQVRDRYTELLRKNASSIQEIFEAEEKIRVLQEEIEAKEGRLKYLQEKVNHSQINLVIYETVLEKEEPTVYQASIGKQFKANLSNGWHIILDFFLILANIWPLIIVGTGLYFFRNRFLKS